MRLIRWIMSWWETRQILSDPETMAAIREAERELFPGRSFTKWRRRS